MSSDFTRPEREFRVGAVRVTIWGNPRYGADGKTWVSHRVAMDRGYKDHDGNCFEPIKKVARFISNGLVDTRNTLGENGNHI